VGRVRIDHLFWQIAVTNVPYPFRSQMAKVQLRAPGQPLGVQPVKGL